MSAFECELAYKLYEYSRWLRCYTGRAPSSMAIFVESRLGSTVAIPQISDDEALLIGYALAELKKNNLINFEVLCLTYIGKLRRCEVAEKLNISRQKVLTSLQAGLSFVEGFWCAKRAA